MTTFVSLAVLLALLTLAFLTRSLWLKPGASPASGQGPALAALRQQLEQLESLRAAGTLGEAQFAEARLGLERRIVELVVNTPSQAVADKPVASRALLFGLAGFVVVVAAAGYALLGTPQALTTEVAGAAPASAETKGAHPLTTAQIEGMVEKLAARLKERPDDADGWAMLGRSYAMLERHDQAVPAFKQAMALRPDDAVLIADYADALAVTNGRKLEGEPDRLIARALKIDPDNLKALSLAGTAAFDRKDYAGALQHWQKMTKLAPDSQFSQQIQSGIDEARRLSGGASAAPAAAPASAAERPAAPGLAAAISGTVSLAPALAAKAGPEDTVFIFARPAEGSRMPLAILRKQVKDLPLKFTLDDSMAMSPAARLSSASRVVVGARISKAGQAMAQPGDLQGLSAPMGTTAQGLKIEISEVVGP
jgi:cytochrome c-type biogenesis protein CcmH